MREKIACPVWETECASIILRKPIPLPFAQVETPLGLAECSFVDPHKPVKVRFKLWWEAFLETWLPHKWSVVPTMHYPMLKLRVPCLSGQQRHWGVPIPNLLQLLQI